MNRGLRTHKLSGGESFPFFKFERSVIHAGRQAKPCSDRVDLRALSPLYMAPICGTVTWLSSTNSRASSGRYSNSVWGGSPCPRRTDSANSFNPVAASCRLDHLKIEGRALFKPLGFEQAAGAFKFGQPVFQFFLMCFELVAASVWASRNASSRKSVRFQVQPFLPREWIKAVMVSISSPKARSARRCPQGGRGRFQRHHRGL